MSPPLRVLVVDDERPARDRLCDLLQRHPDIEMCGVADSGDGAIEAIRRRDPAIVFLDVQMPRKNAFDVIREIGADCMPATVFVTAYDRYALRAFESAAVDYLLKPFEDARFEQALQRATTLVALRRTGAAAARLRAVLSPAAEQPDQEYLQRLAVESRGHVRLVTAQQIDYVTASGVYAELHAGERTYLIRERMQVLEQRLDPRQFMRIHRSIIVRLDRIEMLLRQPGGDYTLVLRGGAQLAVSRNRIESVERWMGVLGPPQDE